MDRVHRVPRAMRGMTSRRCWRASFVMALLCAGCGAPPRHSTQFLCADERVVASGDYRLAPPDSILIHAPIAPEIDGAQRRIRPDGKIALRLLGEVQVAGLTTGEIADKLRVLLAKYYRDPQVVVDVARYGSQNYYVFGEVAVPGPRRYTGRDTLLDALAKAQPNVFAWRSQIRITRPSAKEGERATVVVDLDQMVRDGNPDQDILLQPGDIIEVPPTPVAWVGHQVRALLYPVQPALRAYEAPADFIEANREYRDGDDDDSDGGRLGF